MKQLVDKIGSLDLQIECLIKMKELRQAFNSIVKKGKSGMGHMQNLVELAQSGQYGDCSSFVTLCNNWLQKMHTAPSVAATDAPTSEESLVSLAQELLTQ